MSLVLENVSKIVAGETHLQGINLEFESGSRNVLLDAPCLERPPSFD